jgi:hypothetical protein
MAFRLAVTTLLLSTLAVPAAMADETVTTYRSDDPKLALGSMSVPGGTTRVLNVGIGSGAGRRADDPPLTFWTISDRGPNFTCGDVKDVFGVDGKTICGDVKGGRIYALPDYSPSIYRITLKDGGKTGGSFTVDTVLPLRDGAGTPVNGLLNPLTHASTEQPLDLSGKKLAQNPDAVDAEAIVPLADGTFWVSEENGPSLLHVAADGKIMRRIVPAGTEGDFTGAHYPVDGGLPAVLAKRFLNRGLESLAITPTTSAWPPSSRTRWPTPTPTPTARPRTPGCGRWTRRRSRSPANTSTPWTTRRPSGWTLRRSRATRASAR